MHRHGLRPSSGSMSHNDDGTGDPLSSFVRPSHIDLYRRPSFDGSILQGKYRIETTVGRYFAATSASTFSDKAHVTPHDRSSFFLIIM